MSNPVFPEEQFYSTERVAQIFDVTSETIVSWIKAGRLDAIKVGRLWRIKRASVLELANAKFGSQ